MSMAVTVTRNASNRVRGFLSSVMLEIGPGIYCAPRISPAVRERIWEVLRDWFPNERDASIVMVWQDATVPGGQAVATLGSPPVQFVEIDGLVLTHRPDTNAL